MPRLLHHRLKALQPGDVVRTAVCVGAPV